VVGATLSEDVLVNMTVLLLAMLLCDSMAMSLIPGRCIALSVGWYWDG